MRGLFLALLAFAALGCANKTKSLKRAAAVDLSCDERNLHVTTIRRAGDVQYIVAGCSKHATYVMTSTGAQQIEDSDPASTNAALGDVPPPPPPPADIPPPPPPAR